jgi:hypothetical protein
MCQLLPVVPTKNIIIASLICKKFRFLKSWIVCKKSDVHWLVTIHRSPKKTVNVSPVSPRGAPIMGKNCPPSGEDVENYLVNVRKIYLVGG